MKTIFSPRKHPYLKRVGILLIVVALVAAIVSCNGGVTEYNLTMEVNPAGGGTATDLTNTSPYEANTAVNISAVAAACYRFVGWTAPAGTFGNSNNASTTFTMPARDVTVTANFEPVPPDHFKFYGVDYETAPEIGQDVQLVDQFGAINATVGDAIYFGNPVEKVHGDIVTPISDPDRHYTFYELLYEGGPQSWQVMVNNQFQDDEVLTVQGPFYLAVPTQKEDHEAPVCLDHLLVYDVISIELEEPLWVVDLHDQFLDEQGGGVYEPIYFANPVQKEHPGGTVTEIQNPDEHMVFYYYYIEGEPFQKRVDVINQFGPQTLDLTDPELLAVPSQKIAWEQPLDHFKTYWADWPSEPPPLWEPPTPVDVQLEDQFVTIDATVGEPYLFANPTNKEHGEVWTPIWDPKDHLTFYYIEYGGEPQEWDVTVNNQFGNDQVLRVAGPFYLAVPTGKLAPDWPADLNHFLVYEVYSQAYPTKNVYIEDQFMEGWTNMHEPHLFAVPAQKTDASGTTDIKGDEHLVFYWIDGIESLNMYNLAVINQFGDQYLDVFESDGNFLGVPSQKIGWEGPYPYKPLD